MADDLSDLRFACPLEVPNTRLRISAIVLVLLLLPGVNRKMELSADAFNLFNSDAAFGFLSADARSANFGVKTNFVQPRVGQVGVRFVF